MIVTLYTKPGCHLCEAVEQVIARARARREFKLVVRNIEDDPADFARYHTEIPVVMLDGREVARHRLSAAEFDAALSQSGAQAGALVLMTKVPAPGVVKTRLMPELNDMQAARVHEVFLRHVARRLSRVARLVVCFDPPDAGGLVREFLDIDTALLPQSSGDLGDRLASAFASVAADRVLFFGVDSPDVPTSAIRRVDELLRDNDVVIGPCPDGGFWCLGMDRSVNASSLLASIEWSSGREREQTVDRARALGYRVALANAWDDVDRPHDLRRLVTRLQKSDNGGDAPPEARSDARSDAESNAQLLRELELLRLPQGVIA
jgi:rSAM/selenodomain-associated transferase 1